MKFKRSIKNIVMAVISQIIGVALAIMIPRLVITGYGSEVNGLLSTIGNIYTYLALIETGIGTVAVQALYSRWWKMTKRESVRLWLQPVGIIINLQHSILLQW